jgi:mono/diheme cytochrome c family protein
MNRRLRRLAVFGIAAGCAGFAVAQDIQNGKKIYATQKCVLCHSIAGIGNKKHPLDGVGSKLKSEQIRGWIKSPQQMNKETTMKGYPTLPDKDLEDLTAYLLSLK